MPRPPTLIQELNFNDIPGCLEKFRYLCQFIYYIKIKIH